MQYEDFPELSEKTVKNLVQGYSNKVAKMVEETADPTVVANISGEEMQSIFNIVYFLNYLISLAERIKNTTQVGRVKDRFITIENQLNEQLKYYSSFLSSSNIPTIQIPSNTVSRYRCDFLLAMFDLSQQMLNIVSSELINPNNQTANFLKTNLETIKLLSV